MIKDIKFTGQTSASILNGINKIANAVKATLGPKGRNVMISKMGGSVTITKDGVSVAKAVELEDTFENMAAQAIKEAALKTAERAGDGTTTAVVLTQSIAQEGLKITSTGINPIGIKRGIDKGLKQAIQSLKSISKTCTNQENIEQVATVSANGDKAVGKIISKAIQEVGSGGTVTVADGQGIEHELEIVKGMRFDRGYISPYLVNRNNMKAEFDKPNILIVDEKLSNFTELVPVLEKSLQTSNPLVIIAEDIESEVLQNLVMNNIRGVIKVTAVKAPGFGDKRKSMLEDIAILTNAKVIGGDIGTKLAKIQKEDLGEYFGTATNVKVTKEDTTIIGGAGEKQLIENRANLLIKQAEETTSSYEKEQLEERAAKLTNGIGVIKVGAATEIEMKEIKDRIDDALNATRAAIEEGVVPGGGVALLKISKKLEDLKGDNKEENFGIDILKKAMKSPIRQILANAGEENLSVIVKQIENNQDNFYGYDVAKEEFGNMYNFGVIDPTKVTREAIQNAASAASLLMTTDVMIGEKTEKKDNNPTPDIM